MTKTIFLAVSLFLFACNSGNENVASDADTTIKADQALTYATPFGYSSQFKMGDNKNAQTILDIWKDFDNNTLNNIKDKLADSIILRFSGMETISGRDSMVTSIIEYRNLFSTVNSRVDAIAPLFSIDRNEDWVAVWGTEIHTDKNNKTDSIHLQETWRFNKQGKVDMLMQYQRLPPAANK